MQFKQRSSTQLFRGSESSSLVLKVGPPCAYLLRVHGKPWIRFRSRSTSVVAAYKRQCAPRLARRCREVVWWRLRFLSPSRRTQSRAGKISGRMGAGEPLHLTVEVSRRHAPDPSHVLKIPVQIADRTCRRVYVSVYDEQSLANTNLRRCSMTADRAARHLRLGVIAGAWILPEQRPP